MKKLLSFFLVFILLTAVPVDGRADYCSNVDISIDAPYAILMECSSGTVIYEKEAYAHRSPASVTKMMTMLLVAEAVSSGQVSLDDNITASARAASMGGSQIWLEEGEVMKLGEMLKCVAVVSANDCCVALAEHLAGSEEAFVERMNRRAESLGLENTHFVCCSGLSDSDEHYSCARDLAVLGCELLKYDFIREYTSIWMDSIRNGEFTLSNTNRLIYYYEGATGLKTGFTTKAGHCLAASAKRNDVEYIAVVLGAESSAKRFESAKTLLNYAFANFELVSAESLAAIPPVKVTLGNADCVNVIVSGGSGVLVPKYSDGLSCEIELPDEVASPIREGEQLGVLHVYADGTLLTELPLLAETDVDALSIWDIFVRLAGSLL